MDPETQALIERHRRFADAHMPKPTDAETQAVIDLVAAMPDIDKMDVLIVLGAVIDADFSAPLPCVGKSLRFARQWALVESNPLYDPMLHDELDEDEGSGQGSHTPRPLRITPRGLKIQSACRRLLGIQS